MSPMRWVTFWLIAVPAAFLLLTTPATAGVQPFEVRQYEQDFSVPSAVAEENLELQERGSAIVGQLEAVLGKEYAGVWFDNQAGEFVIPLLPGTNQGTVSALLSDDGLGKAFRTTHAASSWIELEATQERIDGALEKQIKAGLVQTSLDPRTNAVAVRQAKAIDKANEAMLQRLVLSENTGTEIKSADTEHFNFEPLACKTSAPRACGRPLRGGVSLTRNTGEFHQVGECSVGFKATANGNRYVLTAGHCAAVFPNWGSEDSTGTFHPIGSVSSYSFPGGDWGKINANGSSYWDWTPWPSEVAHYWEDQERTIAYEGWSYVGDYVCHSGTNTGTSCGGVSALNVTAPYGVSHLTEVKGVCALGGDSGGPVFEGHTALGLLSGGDLEYPECERPILYAEITEATNALGVSVGTRLGGPPTATTNPATNIQKNQATANGEVNPNSVETHYRFEYGTTTGYGSSLPVSEGNAGHGTGTVGVAVVLPNLQAVTTYHYRLVATSPAGTSYGADRQFTTPIGAIPGEDDDFGGPHPALQENGSLDIFYRTPSGGLGHNWFTSALGWHLEGVEGSVASSSVPHPVVQPNGSLDVFYRTPSGGLGHTWYRPELGWHVENLEGSVAGDPHPVVQPNGSIDVFYRTPSGGLGHNWFSSALGWHLENLSGSVAGDPYPVVQPNGSIDVFYRTASGGLGHNWFSSALGWHLENLSGSLDSSATMGVHATAQENGSIDVFYRTPSGGLGHNWYRPELGWHVENLEGSL